MMTKQCEAYYLRERIKMAKQKPTYLLTAIQVILKLFRNATT